MTAADDDDEDTDAAEVVGVAKSDGDAESERASAATLSMTTTTATATIMSLRDVIFGGYFICGRGRERRRERGSKDTKVSQFET